MLKEKKNGRNRRSAGFTLTEMLVVLAILVTLLALGIPQLIKLRKELRQKELDSKAEILYTAAQNQLIKLRAAGRQHTYAYMDDESNGVYKLDLTPMDMDTETHAVDVFFVSKPASVSTAADCILPEGSADPGLLTNSWVVEYDPVSASVYAVFYREDGDIDYSKEGQHEMDVLRFRQFRLNDGAHVGYYGGDLATVAKTTKLEPRVSILNGEKLTAIFKCTRIGDISNELEFTITLTDEAGNSWSHTVKPSAASDPYGTPWMFGATNQYTLVLDDLSSEAARFYHKFEEKLNPGETLTVSIKASCPSNPLIEEGTATVKTNSLFADESADGTAVIRTCRHLQNLDESSGVVDAGEKSRKTDVTAAVQYSDLSFYDDPDRDDDWYDLYTLGGIFAHRDEATGLYSYKGPDNFTPIVNSVLESYTGSYEMENGKLATTVIYGLSTVTDQSCVGLFGEVGTASELTLKSVRLSGTNARTEVSGGSAGALAGMVKGTLIAEDCQIYLTRGQNELENQVELDANNNPTAFHERISAANAGGLIGSAEGTVSLSGSSASTLVGAAGTTSNAGGLIGNCIGDAVITGSYADCYIHGTNVGGLIGKTTGGAKTVLNSYAAGYLYCDDNGTAAGLVNGQAQLKNDYAVCCFDGKIATLYSTASAASAAENTYYLTKLIGSGTPVHADGTEMKSYSELSDRQTMATLLGTAFTKETGGATTAYNLLNQGLEDYSFPRLAALNHYGDWQADFESGKLVYFEQYANGAYGFFGANTDTLKRDHTTVVTGDGYGVAFDTKPTENVYLRFNGKYITVTPKENDNLLAVNDGTNAYWILTLPSEITNTSTASASFYQKVEIMDGAGTGAGVKDSYWFNPHFAQTAVSSDSNTAPELEEGAIITIRSARQLYNLSLYYSKYQMVTEKCEFLQEQDIDYKLYNWTKFAGTSSAVTSQPPIGGDNAPFIARYNGGCCTIAGVDFRSADKNLGFIGRNAGLISNVVLVGGYDGSKGNTVGSSAILQNCGNVTIGTLAGENTGTIRNCAVAGFNQGSVKAYIGSNVALGGLVGSNSGLIVNSSAETPVMNVYSTESKMHVGGLVGENNGGSITNSYAIGSIAADATTKTTDASGESVKTTFVGGITGNNDGGSIQNSYCAVYMSTSGGAGELYALTPYGGYLSNSTYLNYGTFEYAENPRTYNADQSITQGTAKTFADLSASAATPAAQRGLTPELAGNYPFTARVTDRNGKLIHYGNWPYVKDLGIVGVVYWEQETSGSNNGYKFTMIGYNDEKTDAAGKPAADKTEVTTTLCTAHDDGGNVVSYGYGYYTAAGNLDNVTGFTHANTSLGDRNSAAESAMKTLLPQYDMMLYTTGEGSNNLRLSSTSAAVVNDTWTLSLKHQVNGKTQTDSFPFVVSPFFGNSLSFDTSSAFFKNASGAYAVKPGAEGHPYEVRSVQQLRFINWNCSNKNTTTWEESGTYQNFPYLMQADAIDKTAVQKSPSKSTGTNKNKLLYWEQTHDLQGDGVTDYVPIAAHGGHKTTNSYDVSVYGWFGGTYDGGTYAIRNLNITSGCYAVGLFSVTVGANFKNVVLYSDRGSVIERSGCKAVGAYSIGGLIGLALDYTAPDFDNTIENCAIAGYIIRDKSDQDPSMGECNLGGMIGIAKVKLRNCSAVTDIQVMPQYNLIKWSSWETDPATGVYHPTAKSGNTNDTGGNFPSYGMYLRVGGMTGANQMNITNCYTGGSITVSDDVRYTTRNNNSGTVAYGGSFVREKSFCCYIGGISSSEYTPLLQNINGISGSDGVDGESLIENCYTYMEFPRVGGTVLAVSMLGSVADRYYGINHYGFRGTDSAGKSYSNAGSMIQNNCYYFDYSASNIDLSDQAYTMKGNVKLDSTFNSTNEATRLKYMLGGRLSDWYKWVEGNNNDVANTNTKAYGANAANDSSLPQAVSYENVMNGTLLNRLRSGAGAKFGTVTVTAKDGGQIDGKYSFPGNDTSLLGTNYPYPTVLTQTDRSTGETVNVHYGRWVVSKLMWDRAMNSMDIFTDMVTADDVADPEKRFDKDDVTWACKILTLSYKGGSSGTGAKLALTVSDESVLDAEQVGYEDGVYYVKVTAKKPGTATITAADGKDTCDAHVEVTANLKVSANPAEITLHQVPDNDKEHQSVALQATSQTGEKNYSAWDNCEWTVNALTDNLVELTSVTDGAFEVYAWFPGDTMIRCDCNFDYHGLCTCTGTAFTHVYIKEAAMIGLGTGSAFNEALIRTGNKTVAGSDVGYARNAFGELVGPLPMDGSGNPVGSLTVPYLYGLKEDGVLGGGYTIEKITLGGETVYENGLPVNGEKYAVSIGEVSSDSTYNYITLHPATVLEEDQTGVQMVVLVSKGETKYQLKVKVTAPAAPHVTAYFFEQESSVSPVKKQLRIEANKDMPVTLPSLGHSTALHATNTGWHWIESSTRKTGKVGSVVTLPFEDMNLYADWESDWEVSYDANGTGTAPAMSYVERGKSVTLPSMGDVGDLRHVGWSYGGKTYDKGSSYTPTGNVTLKAVWKPIYTITLVSTVDYGTPAKAGVKFDGKTYYSTDTPNTIRVAEGEQISVINNTLEHYTFVNWKDDSGRTAAPGESYTVSGNTTLTANWLKWYMLSLNPNGGKIDGSTDPKELWVEPGKSCTLPDLGVQNWSDHNFRHVKWNGTYAAGESITPTGDMYLSADWTIVYYATFVGNGGKIDGKASTTVEVFQSEYATIPTAVWEHNKLIGWLDEKGSDRDATNQPYTTGGSFPLYNSDVTLTAQWQLYWVIELNADGGTISGDARSWICPDDPFTFPSVAKEHYTFNGWKENTSGTVHSAGETITPDANLSLTAQWLPDWKVTLDANGGSLPDGTVNPIYVHQGDSTTLTTPTKTLSKFKGWKDDTTGTVYDAGNITPNSDLNLTAQWQAYWKISLDAQKGTINGEAVNWVCPDETYTFPNAELTHQTFKGWKNSADNHVYSAGETITPNSDMNLTAQWEADYVITLDKNGGNLNCDGTIYVHRGDSTALPTTPTRNNYRFEGWSTDGTKANMVSITDFKPAANVTLKAVWARKRTVTFTTSIADNLGIGQLLNVKNPRASDIITVSSSSEGAIWDNTSAGGNTWGGSSKTLDKADGDTIIIPSGSYTRGGNTYTIAYWTINRTRYYPGDSFTIDESNVTMTATWQ